MSARLLAGALLLSLAFGSLHAFGVLLEPLQEEFHAGRAEVSLAYALAIAALTLGVFASPRLAAWRPALRALLFGLLGAGGLALAASGLGLGFLLLGYGLVFGLGNGLAYALFIDCAGAALPRRRGVAIGAATAAYGLGAVLSARLLAPIAADAPLTALWLMAAAMGLAGLGASALFAGSSRSTPPQPAASDPAPAGLLGLRLVYLWLVYFLGAFGGLMVIAHAMAILTARGASPEFAALAPALNAAGNVAGSILGGLHADRAHQRRALAWPLAATALALAALLILPSGGAALLLLTVCGGGYGALIAAVPVVVRRVHGADYAPAFGRVFTAWGVAGLLGPLAAGALFDWRRSYDLAIAAALACALAALWVNRAATRPAAHATQP